MSIKSERTEYIDISKGIGIILMVMGHSLNMNSKLRTFIYLFHMPLFFLISGYVIKKDNFYNIKQFVLKKLKSLYLPFLKYTIIFVILHNIFIYFNIYENYGNTARYDIIDFARSILDCFLFRRHGEPLLGTFWFLKTLFLAEVMFILIGNLINRLTNCDLNIFMGFICFILFFIGMVLSIKKITIFLNLERVFVSIFFIYLGYIYKIIEKNIKYKVDIFLIFIAILLIETLKNNKVDMISNEFSNPILFLLDSIIGIYCVFYIAKTINKKYKYKKVIIYIGKNTIIILALHLLAFKIVNFVQVIIYKEPYKLISAYPILHFNRGWWILYTIIGVLIPLFINWIGSKCFLFYKKNLCRNIKN